MDNDAFTNFKPDAFLSALKRWHLIPNCLFVVAPDVVQDARQTLDNFWTWQPVIKKFNVPIAFALQNGMSEYCVPFEYIDAIFIGGSSDFKMTRYVEFTVGEAKKRNKWIHNGRVNGLLRHQHSLFIGCDSVDGTGYAIDPSRIRSEFAWWTTKISNSFQFSLDLKN